MRGWGKQRKVLRKHDWEFCVLKLTHLGEPPCHLSLSTLQDRSRPHNRNSPTLCTVLEPCREPPCFSPASLPKQLHREDRDWGSTGLS